MESLSVQRVCLPYRAVRLSNDEVWQHNASSQLCKLQHTQLGSCEGQVGPNMKKRQRQQSSNGPC